MGKKKEGIPLEVRKRFVKEIEEHLVKSDDSFITILVAKSSGKNKFRVLSDLELEEIIGYMERMKHDLISNLNNELHKEDFPTESFVR